jgi:hypothetical protein
MTADEFNALERPSSLSALGEPEQVFAQSAWAAALAKWFANRGVGTECPPEIGLVFVAIGVFLLGLGLIVPDELLGTTPRWAVLMLGVLLGGSFLATGVGAHVQLLKRKAEREKEEAAGGTQESPEAGPIPDGSAYAIYPDALALVRGYT